MTEHFSPQFKITVLMVDATRAPSHQQTQPRGDREGSEEPTQAGPPPRANSIQRTPAKTPCAGALMCTNSRLQT